MTDLTERKLKACQVKPIDDVPYSEELQALKEKNERQKELIKTLGSDIDYLNKNGGCLCGQCKIELIENGEEK